MPAIQLFITCLVDSFFPQVGKAVVTTFNRLGLDVELPRRQTCCGQPAFNAGLRADARSMAQRTIEIFERNAAPVVIPSGSCVHMFRHGYPELFASDPAWHSRALALAARTFEFTEYLVDSLGVTDLGASWQGILAYHPSCHTLRGIQVDSQPRLLLSHVRNARLVDLPNEQECCGFGGIMSVEHPELSAEWLNRKIQNLEDSQASTLVVTDAGCLMHIAGGLRRQRKSPHVVHIAEILANC